MVQVFADTNYWVGVLTPRDELHRKAKTIGEAVLQNASILTSDLIVVEVLNYLHRRSPKVRQEAFDIFTDIRTSPLIEIVPYSKSLFERAGALYIRAEDKEWSFTDCSSFAIMRERNIHDALTSDHHFEQAGFRALLK